MSLAVSGFRVQLIRYLCETDDKTAIITVRIERDMYITYHGTGRNIDS